MAVAVDASFVKALAADADDEFWRWGRYCCQ